MKRVRVSNEIIHGVYKIENILNGNVYVGSSKDIYGRWVRHRNDLNKEKHHCPHLQASWNKYKEFNFRFEILEKTMLDDWKTLCECEQKWYDYYEEQNVVRYNASKIAKCPSHFTTIDDLKNGKRKITYDQFVSICWHLLNTELSIPKISNLVDVSERTIYQIYFKKQYSELTKDMCFMHREPIAGNNLTGAKLSEDDVSEIICEFVRGACVKDISSRYGVSYTTIRDIYDRKTWEYLSDGAVFAALIESNGRANKPIIQYDLDMNFIAEYESARDAENATGIGYKLISRVCNYKRPHTHGFIFRFKNKSTIQN